MPYLQKPLSYFEPCQRHIFGCVATHFASAPWPVAWMHGRVSVYRVWFGKNATDVGLTSWLHENGKLLRMIRRLRQKNAKKMRLGKMIAKKMRFWKTKTHFFAILKKSYFFYELFASKERKKYELRLTKMRNIWKKCDLTDTEPLQKKCDVTTPSQKKSDLTEPSQKNAMWPNHRKKNAMWPNHRKKNAMFTITLFKWHFFTHRTFKSHFFTLLAHF